MAMAMAAFPYQSIATQSAALCAFLLRSGSVRAFAVGSGLSFGAVPCGCAGRRPRWPTEPTPSKSRRPPRPPSSRRSASAAPAMARGSALVTVREAIEAHRTDARGGGDGPRAVFVDGSWHMPAGPDPRNGRSEFQSGPRVPGALYFDIDDVAPPPGDPSNSKGLPHMKPPARMFAHAMDRMGIRPQDTIYVYASEGCGFYHRAYWTLSSCGYHDPDRVKLMQGSLGEWKANGGELEMGELADDDPRLFRMGDVDWKNESPKYACWKEDAPNSVVDMAQLMEVVGGNASADAVVVDARSAGRFYGRDPEPRPGLRGGRMPGAVNVPFVSLLDLEDKTKFLPMDEVRKIFVEAGVAPLGEGSGMSRRVICSCGSGVTAAALAVGLEECGLREKGDISIYDGSWIEWGGDADAPIVSDEENAKG
ncbi:hypothetical protein ACHAWF_012563 [Thalassiosira exigua]